MAAFPIAWQLAFEQLVAPEGKKAVACSVHHSLQGCFQQVQLCQWFAAQLRLIQFWHQLAALTTG